MQLDYKTSYFSATSRLEWHKGWPAIVPRTLADRMITRGLAVGIIDELAKRYNAELGANDEPAEKEEHAANSEAVETGAAEATPEPAPKKRRQSKRAKTE